MARIETTPDLLEEAVFLAMRRGGADAAAWERERELLYALPAGPAREARFAELSLRRSRELGLERPLRRALECCPSAMNALATLYVRRAERARDEGSELYAAPSVHGEGEHGARAILTLRPERFLDLIELERFALRELLYIDDMLDAAFGYRPELPLDPGDEPARRELHRDRFRVLWEARVLGRAARIRGEIAALPTDRRLRAAFGASIPSAQIEALIREGWSGALATQADLFAAARMKSSAVVPR